MSTVFLDYETVDPHLKVMGPGWAYKGCVPVSACVLTDKGYEYYTLNSKILQICNKATTIVCHNAQYDCGILHSFGVDLSKKTIICTQLLSNIAYNVLPGGHSLGSLSKYYLNDCKSNDPLGIAAAEIMPVNINLDKPGGLKRAKKWAITNMDKMIYNYPNLVEEYCVHDVRLLKGLYDILIKRVDQEWVNRLSNLIKLLIKTRAKGVRLDTELLQKEQHMTATRIEELRDTMFKMANTEFNPNSSVQLADVLSYCDIEVPTTAAGAPSVTLDFLSKQEHEFPKIIYEYKKLNKFMTGFVLPYINMQEVLPDKYKGRLYPCLNPFAAITGRFSSSNPNAQQIPMSVRKFILPEVGEKISEGDFSSQEGRLAVHYAYLTECRGADILVKKFKENPNLDLHQQGADLCGISRKEAKAINLGILYGMGINKLAEGLGVTAQKAKVIKEKYNTEMPYISELADRCKKMTESRGYLNTLLGRKTYADISTDGRDLSYKMINKLIQGSAADQCIEAMLQLDAANIPIIFPVHDAIVFSHKDGAVVDRVKEIMETCVSLKVPMATEIKTGKNWSECK